ncbi:MAG: ATP-dependent DNA ligase [Jatrophihabitans sp.]
MLILDLAATSEALAAMPGRIDKAQLIASLLADRFAKDVALAVDYLVGELPQRQIGVGYAALRDLPEPAAEASLTVAEFDAAAEQIGRTVGAGSQELRRSLLVELLARATEVEQRFLVRLLLGDLRQGALAGVMLDAVARCFEVPLAGVRRAAMLRGNLPSVAAALAEDGKDALARFHLEVGRPISPMLAQTSASIADAMTGAPVAVEWKLDGARLQIHRGGESVSLYTRTLDDVTSRLPEVVDAVLALPVKTLVADGEVIALHEDGRPRPFQATASRFGTRVATDELRRTLPVTLFVFDLLHVDGADLLDASLTERRARLEAVIPERMRVPHIVTTERGEAERFSADTLAAGHEGVMVKTMTAPYEAGRRGASWRKVKPVHTLDLVVLAVERGSGRRSQWLSNIHLGARDEMTGEFVMLGKTFKGMTDVMLAWQTERFTELATGPVDEWVVPVRPEQVVEVAFDGVQNSTRYPGGVALRFARVLRYRDDKSTAEVDTLQTVRELQRQ